ncbi:MAG: hypothetical protein IJ457_05425 [Clostridia bacterium]|nr:hypothetical protein [Clostridia bacterium]
MRKTFITLSLVFLLVLSVSTSILAINSFSTTSPKKDFTKYTNPSYIDNGFADTFKSLDISRINPDSKESVVKYTATQRLSNNYIIDIYCDNSGNEYYYDTSGEIIGYNENSDTKSDTNNSLSLSMDAVSKIAETFANSLYENEFTNYTLTHSGTSGDEYYYVFIKTAGDTGFITTRRCTVFANESGNIKSSILSQETYPDSFDLSKLNDIRESEVTANITEQLKDIFTNASNISITDVYVAESGNSLLAMTEFNTDIEITNEMVEGYDFCLIDENRYSIYLYYPLS